MQDQVTALHRGLKERGGLTGVIVMLLCCTGWLAASGANGYMYRLLMTLFSSSFFFLFSSSFCSALFHMDVMLKTSL